MKQIVEEIKQSKYIDRNILTFFYFLFVFVFVFILIIYQTSILYCL